MPWWTLEGLIRHLPRDSAVMRSELGEAAEWSLDTHLAAYIADLLALLLWQNGGGKKSDLPAPVPRPGDQPDGDVLKADRTMTPKQLDAFLASIQHGKG